MNDFEELRERFEMAEVLTSDEGEELRVEAVDQRTGDIRTVVFSFDSGDLVELNIEE